MANFYRNDFVNKPKTAIWSDLSQASVILNNEFFGEAGGGSVDVTPGVGELVFEGYSPTISTPRNILAGVGQLVMEGFSPSVDVTNNINISTQTGNLVFEGYSPIVSVPRNILPQTGNIIFTGFAATVTVTQNTNVSPGVGEAIFIGYAPIVTGGGVGPTPPKIRTGTSTFGTTGGFLPELKKKRNIDQEDQEILAIIQTFIQCQK